MRRIFALAGIGLAACSNAVNLFQNPNFDFFSDPQIGLGVLPDGWIPVFGTPSTFSNTGSYGLPITFNNLYTGLLAHSSSNFVGCDTTNNAIFGQIVPGLVAKRKYRVMAYLSTPTRPDLIHPCSYQIYYMAGPNDPSPTLLGTFIPVFTPGWKQRFAIVEMPATIHSQARIVFRAVSTTMLDAPGDTFPAIDTTSLDDATTKLNVDTDIPDYVGNSGTMDAVVEIRYPGTLIAAETLYGSVGNSGTFVVRTLVPDGVYDIAIKGDTTLRRVLKNVNITFSETTLPVANLVNGDCDGSNAITTDDYLILSNAFDTVRGGTGFDPRADLNKDGAVTTDDYLTLSANFDREGED